MHSLTYRCQVDVLAVTPVPLYKSLSQQIWTYNSKRQNAKEIHARDTKTDLNMHPIRFRFFFFFNTQKMTFSKKNMPFDLGLSPGWDEGTFSAVTPLPTAKDDLNNKP